MQVNRDCSILAGTALALVLTISSAVAMDNSAIEAAIPIPESAGVAPLTPADIAVKEPALPLPPASVLAPPNPAPSAKAEAGGPAAPPLASVDQEVAEKLRAQLGSRNRKAPIDVFYTARDYAPLWITNGQANARAKAAIARLARAEADGLDSSDYAVPSFSASDPGSLADAELKLSNAVATFARHAQSGRVHFSRVSSDISFDLDVPEVADVLAEVAKAEDVGAALSSYNPPHPQFKALRDKLAEVRGQKEQSSPRRIQSGPTLKIGMRDDRVPLLRERLGVTADVGSEDLFDKDLSAAVKRFQQQNRMSITGRLTNATVDVLNGPRRDKDADIIIANMERWRWMPRDLGKTHVIVNVPEYRLRVIRDGALYWTTRIVVGKPSQATPIMTSMMQYITVNPTWNVPPSIIQNEYLPALQQDPTALERIGLKVTYRQDGTIHVYQPPGDRNALGRIRFNFPNKFLVYQHDTPDKHLFAHDKRAYSHGCMRVQDPLKYGEVLLSLVRPEEGYTAERLRRMFGSAEQNIQFPKHLPVHLTYQTAYVDDNDKLVILEDIYGRDARMLAIFKGEERRVADIAVERKPTTLTRPVRAPNGFGGGFYSGGYSDGPSFFDRLFGVGGPPPPPARPQRRAYR